MLPTIKILAKSKLNQKMAYTLKLFLFILIVSSCSNRNYMVSCVDTYKTGYVNLTLSNQRKATYKRNQEARKQAIRAILFTGVAQSSGCPTIKPMLQTFEEKKKFEAISNEIFSKRGLWIDFTAEAPQQKGAGNNGNMAIYPVTVSTDQLRNYLEQKKIVKPLKSIF